MAQVALTRMRPFRLHHQGVVSRAINAASPILHVLILPAQWFAWPGELAHAHPALARQFVDRISHESKMWLIARAGLS